MKGRRKRLFNLQAAQIHPSPHLSHLSHWPQVVQERRPQMGFLGTRVVPVGQEALEAPDETM